MGSPAISDAVLDGIVPPNVNPGQRGLPRMLAGQRALYELSSIKSPEFDVEQEWRAIFLTGVAAGGQVMPQVPVLQHRVGRLCMVPFIDIPLIAGSIREIVVGPGGDQPLRVRSVKRTRLDLGFSEIEVQPSRASYRVTGQG
jgi:hypothetical protein